MKIKKCNCFLNWNDYEVLLLNLHQKLWKIISVIVFENDMIMKLRSNTTKASAVP